MARNQRGSAPVAAMSLALTWTEYRAYLVGGEGDRVGLGNEDPVLGHGNNGGVLADARPDEDTGVGDRGVGEETVKEVGGGVYLFA